jgi:SAM-dependent methyltransferase
VEHGERTEDCRWQKEDWRLQKFPAQIKSFCLLHSAFNTLYVCMPCTLYLKPCTSSLATAPQTVNKENTPMTEKTWNEGRLFQVSGSYWQACCLHAAVEMDIFTLIGNEIVSPDRIAAKLDASEDGVKRLLDALSAMGLLTKDLGRYSNSPDSKALLVKDSPDYAGHIISHHHHLVSSWARLPEAVKSGEPVREESPVRREDERESFLMGMFNLAMGNAPRLAPEIDLAGRRHLIDLGGGPGTYAIHFCLENPELRGTIYDLPTTEPFARKTVERFRLSDRIDFVGGDYVEEELSGSYDVAWLSHVLHGESRRDCREILRKVASVLEPGGLILIHEFILNDQMDGPLFPALFSLNMLVNTESGRSYSESQLKAMLEDVGAKEIRRLSFRGTNDSGIMAGVVG